MTSSLTKGLWFHSRFVSLREESQHELLLFKGQIRACDVHVDICTISSKQKQKFTGLEFFSLQERLNVRKALHICIRVRVNDQQFHLDPKLRVEINSFHLIYIYYMDIN